MAKVKLEYDDETGTWYEDESVDFAVEVPDAIIADFRETRVRLLQLHDYFDEHVQPQLDAAYKLRAEKWRRTHPEEAKRNDSMRDVWSEALRAQIENRPTLFVHQPSFRLFDEPPIKKDDE